jgi:hypothetical protein
MKILEYVAVRSVLVLVIGCAESTPRARPPSSSSACNETVGKPLIEGRGRVNPSPAVRDEARAKGLSVLTTKAWVCVAGDGAVIGVEVVVSSSIRCYDELVAATLERSRFSMFTRSGDGCGRVTIARDLTRD